MINLMVRITINMEACGSGKSSLLDGKSREPNIRLLQLIYFQSSYIKIHTSHALRNRSQLQPISFFRNQIAQPRRRTLLFKTVLQCDLPNRPPMIVLFTLLTTQLAITPTGFPMLSVNIMLS